MSDQLLMDHVNSILEDSKHKKSLHEIYEARREELNLSDTQIAGVLQIEYNTLKNIVTNKQQKIDYVILAKLSRFLNIQIDELAKLYHRDNTELANELGSVMKYTYLVENFDLKTLKTIGLIKSVSDFAEAEERIKRFFGLDRLTDYEYLATGVLFSKSKRTPHQRMRSFWVRSAHSLFQKIDNPNEYDREQLKKLIPKIRPYTQNVEKGLITVIQALFNIGVTVIFQPYLSGTQVRGGTFYVNGKPCIVITDFQKSYPTMWFALLHELSHALFDLDTIRDVTYHLSGDDEPDVFLLDEDKANNFARDFLFSVEKSKYIRPYINNHHLVRKYAEQNEIHPSIIYRFYQWDKDIQGQNFWGAYRKYFPDVDKAIEQMNLIPWEKETLDETVDKLKKTLIQFT